MADEKTSTLSKALSIVATVATLSVPILYIIGSGYNQGYLEAYGVSVEFFPRSFQETLMYAFYAFLRVAISAINLYTSNGKAIAVISALVFFAACPVVFVSRGDLGARLSLRMQSIRKWRYLDYVTFPTAAWLICVGMPYFLVVAVFLVLMVPSFGYFKGRDAGRAEIAKMKSCSDSPNDQKCIALKEPGKDTIRGHLVAESNGRIAVYNNGKTSIYRFDDQVVEVQPSLQALQEANNTDDTGKAQTPPSP